MIQSPRDNFKRRRSGFTMVEVMFSMIVFLMMVLVFAAVFPFAVKASLFSNNYAQAALLAQHKVDQIRELGYSNIMVSDVFQTAALTTTASVADPGTCNLINSGTALQCSFTDVDNIATNGTNVGYYPPGSTGVFTITPDASAGKDLLTGAYNALDVNVLISWSGAGMSSGRYAVTAVLGENPHT